MIRNVLLSACFLLVLQLAAGSGLIKGIHSIVEPDVAVSKKHHHKKAFITPPSCEGLFIQERASKQLPGPGQHFRFGALKEWEEVHAAMPADSKLVLLVRHGQAISNWLSDYLGPDVWYTVEETCNYKENGTNYEIFDAALTDLGKDQAQALNFMLDGGGWFKRLTAGKTARVIISPLSRCLATSGLILNNLKTGISEWNVEEDVRETLGEDTCDARRAASSPQGDDDDDDDKLVGPCEYTDGLRDKFPSLKFPVRNTCDADNGLCANAGFGLSSDEDSLWTKKRETQSQQVKRATRFLTTLFEHAPEQIIFVVTHSGFTRSVLLAAGREPYRPQNTELVPIIISKAAGSPPKLKIAGAPASAASVMAEEADEERGWSDFDA